MAKERPRRANRKQRTPLGVPRSKLSLPTRPGYVRRWINDNGGRIEEAQEAGYEFVSEDVKAGEGLEDANTDLGSRKSQIVGTKYDGTPMRAYAMEIPEEWYQEDQQAKQEVVDQKDQAIRQGSLNREEAQSRYVPREGISYRNVNEE